MTDGLLIAADEFFSNGWRGPTLFRASGGLLTPIASSAPLVDRVASASERIEIPPMRRAGTRRHSTGEADIHIPGTLFAQLIDHHVHLGLIDPTALMPGGITEAHDLGWIPEVAELWSEQSGNRSSGLPVVLVAGAFLTCNDGYPVATDWAPRASIVEIASVDDAIGAVAAQLRHDAAFIKVTLNSASGPTLSDDLLGAIVGAAHDSGVPVTAHVEGRGEAARAFAAGVDVFAHTPFSEGLDDLLIERMAQQMQWISTLDIHGWGTSTGEFETASHNLRRFAAAGGPVLYGTDLGNGPLPVGVNERELIALADAGLDGDTLVRSIAGPGAPAAIGPRFAWVPGLPPGRARDTAHWLATARGCTIDDLCRSYVRVDVKNPRVCGDLPGVSGDGSVYFSPIGMGWLSSSNARRWMIVGIARVGMVGVCGSSP